MTKLHTLYCPHQLSPTPKNSHTMSTSSSREPPLPPPNNSNNSHPTWGPYSSPKDFDANMATILIILVLATAFSFGVHAVLRILVAVYRRRRHPHRPDNKQQPKDAAPSLADALPSLVFSPGTRLAGGDGAECAICLTEFVDGDRVRVMPACNHGFHVKCVEAWLSTRTSCPTCRTSCRPEEAEEP